MAARRGKGTRTIEVTAGTGSTQSAEEIRRGPLGQFVRWFEKYAGPGAQTSTGGWRWGVDPDKHLEVPEPLPTAAEMVPGHEFVGLFVEADAVDYDSGDFDTEIRGATHGCRDLLAFVTSGTHNPGGGGVGLEVYPNETAWDWRAADLRERQAKLDTMQKRGPWAHRDEPVREAEAERDDPSDELIKLISAASESVQEDLRVIGSHSAFLWPSPAPRLWGGYSYEIPKEEQIRSAFWAKLHNRDSLVCELEWNAYEIGPRGVQVDGEIDLVGFRVNPSSGDVAGPDVLLEFKRVWLLTRWNNKRDDQRGGLEQDVLKLRRVVAALRSMTVPCVPRLVGVLVAGFTHSEEALDRIEALHPDLEEFGLRRVPLSRTENRLCRAPIDDKLIYDVFMRLDLLVLDESGASR